MTIQKTRMFGGSVVFSAWEPSACTGRHGTITSNPAGGWLGRVGTRDIPAAVEAMRGGSHERIAACDAHRAAQYAEAYAAIIAAYPEAADGRRDMGEIELTIR